MSSKLAASDPRPMIGIAVGILAVAAVRFLSSIPIPHPSTADLRLVGLVAATVLTIATALASQRIIQTRRTLGSRRSFAVVPADQFDAKRDVVVSFASQLASSERSIGGWRDRPASGLRVRIAADPAGNLVYLLDAPARSQNVLRAALRSYEGIELRDPEEILGRPESDSADGPPRQQSVTMRTELVLAQPSVEPLARPAGDPDPLQPFAAAMAAGTEAEVVLDLLPATGRRRRRLRRRLLREARRRHGDRPAAGGGLLDELLAEGGGGGRGRRARPDELLERRLVGQALDAKLKDSGPLFQVQVLCCCRAGSRPEAKAAMHRLLAAFEPATDRNWLRASGLPIPGLAFLGSDLPLRRRRFDRRLRTGLFRPARRSILTARELAGFLKPPTINCRADNVLRSGALLPPPPALPTFSPERKDLIPIGRVATEKGNRLVGVQIADTFFTYITGRSRYGKTETAIAQFVHLVRSGQGGSFLDPHGDALDRIAPYLREPEVAERVVEIDLRPGRSLDALPGWNLFELGGATAAEREARVEAIVDAFSAALEWGDRSTRAINLTTQAASSLATIASKLPPGLSPTIFQITTILSDDDWRDAVLPYLAEEQRSFWTDRFPALAAEAITPVTNMVDRLRASTPLAVLFGRSQSSYRAREAMDQGQIVLFCPGAGGQRDRLAANLFVYDQYHSARGRGDGSKNWRRPFWPFYDEVQGYDGSGIFAPVLEQLAKFEVHGTFLNQNPDRLSAPTRDALLTNRSHLLVSGLNSRAARLITQEWGDQPNADALTGLPRFVFISQVTDRGVPSAPFRLGGLQVEDVVGEASTAAPAAAAADVGEVGSAEETLEHLATLNQRILEGLSASERGTGRPGSVGQLKVKRSTAS